MSELARLMAVAECTDVSQFIDYCRRDHFVCAGQHIVAKCRDCHRFAVPGQFLCTECLSPEEMRP